MKTIPRCSSAGLAKGVRGNPSCSIELESERMCHAERTSSTMPTATPCHLISVTVPA